MGGRGGTSGIRNSSAFEKISLSGKTGTDKQKNYAESLAESARLTAKENGIAGYSKTEGSSTRRYTSKEDADSVKGAYQFLSESVKNTKTYGEVITILKNNRVLDLANTIKIQAKKNNKSIDNFVKDYLELARKKKR